MILAPSFWANARHRLAKGGGSYVGQSSPLLVRRAAVP